MLKVHVHIISDTNAPPLFLVMSRANICTKTTHVNHHAPAHAMISWNMTTSTPLCSLRALFWPLFLTLNGPYDTPSVAMIASAHRVPWCKNSFGWPLMIQKVLAFYGTTNHSIT